MRNEFKYLSKYNVFERAYNGSLSTLRRSTMIQPYRMAQAVRYSLGDMRRALVRGMERIQLPALGASADWYTTRLDDLEDGASVFMKQV